MRRIVRHRTTPVGRLADRIAGLVDGRIVSPGTPRTLGARNRAAAQIVFGLPAGSELPAPLAARVTAAGGRAELATDRADGGPSRRQRMGARAGHRARGHRGP